MAPRGLSLRRRWWILGSLSLRRWWILGSLSLRRRWILGSLSLKRRWWTLRRPLRPRGRPRRRWGLPGDCDRSKRRPRRRLADAGSRSFAHPPVAVQLSTCIFRRRAAAARPTSHECLCAYRILPSLSPPHWRRREEDGGNGWLGSWRCALCVSPPSVGASGENDESDESDESDGDESAADVSERWRNKRRMAAAGARRKERSGIAPRKRVACNAAACDATKMRRGMR